jgi:hypothetical protein
MLIKMTDKALIKLIKETGRKIEMDSAAKERVRNLLMAKIETDKAMTDRPAEKVSFWLKLADAFVPANFAFKPVATFSLAMALFLITSFATVNASKNTLPGNPLYNVKIGAERLRYLVAFSDEARTKASMEIAKKRAGELKQLMSVAEGPNKELLGAVVSEQLANELNNVKEKLNQFKSQEKDAVKLAAMVKELDEQVVAMEKDLPAGNDKNSLKNVLAKAEEVKFVVLSTQVNQYEAGVGLNKETMTEKIAAQMEQLLKRTGSLKVINKIDEENLRLAKDLLRDADKFLVADNLSAAWLKIQQADELIRQIENNLNGGEVKGEKTEATVPTTTTTTTIEKTGQEETINGDIILNDWMNSQKEQPKEEFRVEAMK